MFKRFFLRWLWTFFFVGSGCVLTRSRSIGGRRWSREQSLPPERCYPLAMRLGVPEDWKVK